MVFLWQELSWLDGGFRLQFDKADAKLRELLETGREMKAMGNVIILIFLYYEKDLIH